MAAMEVDPGGFSLPIFQDLRLMQATHGLRSGDYQRYRRYCQRRIGRLCRESKALRGHWREFIKQEGGVADPARTRGMGMLLLLQAERAWAYAEELKEESGGQGRKRQHQMGRLKRAALWGRHLQRLCVAAADAATRLQAEAYAQERAGGLHIVKGNYEGGLAAFTAAANALAQVAHLDPVLAEAASQRMGDVQQSRRLCAYKLGQDPAALEAVSADAPAGAPAAPSDLTWRGQSLRFPSEKLRQKAQEAGDRAAAVAAEFLRPRDLGSGPAAVSPVLELFDRLFTSYHDAIAIVKQNLRSETADSGQQHLLLNYFTTALLQHTLRRNRLLLDSYAARYAAQAERSAKRGGTVRPADLVRLCDLLIHTATELLATPGMDEDNTAVETQAALLLHRATRLYWKAEAFRHASQPTEAVASLTRASELAAEAVTLRRSHRLDPDPEAEALAVRVRALRCAVQGSAVLQTHQAGEQLAAGAAGLSLRDDAAGPRRAADCLDEFVECEDLIAIPIDPVVVPCKPLFYDVAANFLVEPDLTHRAPKSSSIAPKGAPERAAAPKPAAPAEPAPAKQGGWLSSFWS
jgi:signal recognition particle subunit SRP68